MFAPNTRTRSFSRSTPESADPQSQPRQHDPARDGRAVVFTASSSLESGEPSPLAAAVGAALASPRLTPFLDGDGGDDECS